MKKARMTVEELNELKPSWENPIKLICDDEVDDEVFIDDMFKIKVITPVINDYFAFLDVKGELFIAWDINLKYYPSFKEEKRDDIIELRETITSDGVVFVDSEGRSPYTDDAKPWRIKQCLEIKNPRKQYFNTDTGEIVDKPEWWEEE